jgi:amino acid transporter
VLLFHRRVCVTCLHRAHTRALLLDVGASSVCWLTLSADARTQVWISVDAGVVLSGAVLTSYVGIGGLMRRLASDKVMPALLLQENPCRRTPHYVIVGFFLLTSSLCIITEGSVEVLTGVYCVAFLSVMSLFAIANMILKYKRKLDSEVQAPWWTIFVGLLCVSGGAVGNVIKSPEYLEYFSFYYVFAMAIIAAMFARVTVMKMAYFATRKVFGDGNRLSAWIQRQVKSMRSLPIIFFTRTGQVSADELRVVV